MAVKSATYLMDGAEDDNLWEFTEPQHDGDSEHIKAEDVCE